MENKLIQKDKHNCISFWYPVLQELGIPTPKTELVELTLDQCVDIVYTLDGKPSEAMDWLKSGDDYYCIDMAKGEQSFKWGDRSWAD